MNGPKPTRFIYLETGKAYHIEGANPSTRWAPSALERLLFAFCGISWEKGNKAVMLTERPPSRRFCSRCKRLHPYIAARFEAEVATPPTPQALLCVFGNLPPAHIQEEPNGGAGLFTPSERPKMLPLPVLPPIAEMLCRSCSLACARPMALTAECREHLHSQVTRHEWER